MMCKVAFIFPATGLPVPSNPHPLQVALDRATTASFTVVDLIDIARERKPVSASGREARPDARQTSLYRAAIASTIAAIEDTFEALTVAGLRSLGTPQLALDRLTTVIGKTMQVPNPQNLDNLCGDYLGFKPSDHWLAHLSCSPPAYSRARRADPKLDYRNIFTVHAGLEKFEKAALSDVLTRFVRIRNSFAHQDVVTSIFTKKEQGHLRDLRKRKALVGTEEDFVKALSTTCAVTLDANAAQGADPLVRWTLHETHAINVLLLYLGLVASVSDALAKHIEATTSHAVGSYDRLILRVQEGRWCDWDQGHNFSTTNVDFELVAYNPLSR